MIVFFILLAVLFGWLLQHFLLEKLPDYVTTDHRVLCRMAEPGEPFTIQVTLTNRSRLPIPYVRWREYIPGKLSPTDPDAHVRKTALDEWVFSHSAFLKQRESVTFSFSVTGHERGRYVFSHLEYSTGDLLGLSERTKRCDVYSEIVIAPKKRDENSIPEMFYGWVGQVSVRRFLLEDPILTAGYRDYTGREPMKQIDWKQSARGTGLMVRCPDTTADPTVRILLNAQSVYPEQDERFEICCEMARTICHLLEIRHISYGFVTNSAMAGNAPSDGLVFSDGSGRGHLENVLEILGRALFVPRQPLFRLLETIKGDALLSGGWILITPSEDDLSAQLSRADRRLFEEDALSLFVLTPDSL